MLNTRVVRKGHRRLPLPEGLRTIRGGVYAVFTSLPRSRAARA
jgi:hypothetical protein